MWLLYKSNVSLLPSVLSSSKIPHFLPWHKHITFYTLKIFGVLRTLFYTLIFGVWWDTLELVSRNLSVLNRNFVKILKTIQNFTNNFKGNSWLETSFIFFYKKDLLIHILSCVIFFFLYVGSNNVRGFIFQHCTAHLINSNSLDNTKDITRANRP